MSADWSVGVTATEVHGYRLLQPIGFLAAHNVEKTKASNHKKAAPVSADAPGASALTTQPGGTHYKECTIQPVQYIEANSLKFLEGCIVKRATRHDKDTGKGREDIEKIIHEAKLILELRYGG